MEGEKILITGASGFIGSFIVEEALEQGMEVWAAVRKGSSRQYLQDQRIRFVELDFSSREQMVAALRGKVFDYVVHAAGATKALDIETFYKVNTDGTVNFIRALEESCLESGGITSLQKSYNMPCGKDEDEKVAGNECRLKRFVFISSLSIFGSVRDRRPKTKKLLSGNQQPYTEILLTDTPEPNTCYGKSKLRAEEWIRQNAKLPYTILRPTGVYGPREKDYALMADSIRKHVDIASGWSKQDLTFVYVRDVVQAVFLSMKSPKTIGKAYFLSDGEVYDSTEFSRLVMKAVGVSWVLRLRMPLCILKAVCAVCDMWSHITRKPSTLNNDHYAILAQRNWRCDITPAIEDFGYHPEWQLARGVEETFSNGKWKMESRTAKWKM